MEFQSKKIVFYSLGEELDRSQMDVLIQECIGKEDEEGYFPYEGNAFKISSDLTLGLNKTWFKPDSRLRQLYQYMAVLAIYGCSINIRI